MDINIEKRNKIEDNTGAETNKKIPDRKRKFPVLKFKIVFKKIIYLWNNINNINTKNFINLFFGFSILDMLRKNFELTLPAGFEPAAHCLEGSCSIQLS